MKNSCLATLAAFLLALFLSLFALTLQVKILTDANFLNNTIKKTGFFRNLPDFVDSYIKTNNSSEQDLNGIVLTKIMAQSLNGPWLEKESAVLITSFINYANGSKSSFDYTLNLTEAKNMFKKNWTEFAPGLFTAEYVKLSACLEGVSPVEISEAGTVIKCQSPSLTTGTLETSAKNAGIDQFLDTIPENISFNELIQKNPSFNQIKTGFKVLNVIFWLSLVLTILSLAGLVALGWPDFRLVSVWIGWVFILVGGPILIFDLLNKFTVEKISGLLNTQISADIVQFVNPILMSFNQSLIKSTIGISITIVGIGLVLVILSFVLPKYEPRVMPPVQ